MKAVKAVARPVTLALLTIGLMACTSVGVHTSQRQAVDYGPHEQLRVCVLKTDDVSDKRVSSLIAAVNDEFKPYALEVVVPWTREWKRAGFTHDSMFQDVISRDLEPGCDRLFGFVGRHIGDAVWGLFLPEILGEVDDPTHTRGFVVANAVSTNQLMIPPKKTTVHEFYHMLGCPHAGAMDACYSQIKRIKKGLRAHADFFPGMSQDGRLLTTQREANDVLRQARGEVALSDGPTTARNEAP